MMIPRVPAARKFARVLLDVSIVLLVLSPILWGLSSSLKPANRILQIPVRLIPDPATIEHYVTLVRHGLLRYMTNTILVSTAVVLLCLVMGSLAAYALSRFSFPGRRGAMLVIVTVMSIPLTSLLVPTYTFIANVGLLDTRLALIMLYTAYEMPIVIWIMFGYLNTIPQQLDHAAMIDGYGRLDILRRIILPLSGPGLVAAGLFVLVGTWNEFILAVIVTSSEAVRTLPVAVYFYLGFFGRDWGPLLAASMVSALPIILLFAVFQKHFVSGMTGGSVKG